MPVSLGTPLISDLVDGFISHCHHSGLLSLNEVLKGYVQ